MRSLKNLKYQVVFDAIPSLLISKVTPASKIKNLFYCIYGCYIKHSKEYIVVDQVYKKVNKRNGKGCYFEKVDGAALSFKDKTKVMKYISEYLWKFSEHKRISNLMVQNKKELTELELNSILDVWYSKIQDYYLSLEQLSALNNLAKKLTNKNTDGQ
jgi:hypothetical protein